MYCAMDMCIFLHMTDETHPFLYDNDHASTFHFERIVYNSIWFLSWLRIGKFQNFPY